MKIRVWAPSRLHFGLISLGGDEGAERRGQETRAEREARAEREQRGQETRAERKEAHAEREMGVEREVRHYGGVGLMVESPGLQLIAEPAKNWGAQGPLAGRALEFAHRFCASFPSGVIAPHHLSIENAPDEHVGLGTGTQLGMAVGKALASACGLEMSAADLACRVGRGARSGLGVHGFVQGGFLVDGGKRRGQELAALAARMAFPPEWRVVLVLPPRAKGLHGERESAAFQLLCEQAFPASTTETLCRLIVLGMLPALAEQDWQDFGHCVYEFNRRVGETFQSVQGGVYADPGTTELVAFIRRQGIPGVGQSSWGPAVFALLDSESRAADVARRIRAQFALDSDAVFSVRACNEGARITGASSSGAE
jgi:beta-ribofuranosylaminobenzene 5'-phosphate synthase